jgi:2,4-dienoyl-CoA reductase-like NADH-dependent reductase (Old Yellow Enzyme family)/thioredoxin reductase
MKIQPDSPLLTPVSLGPAEINNRVISSSHQTSLVHDHLPTDDLIEYHRARAAGGVGAIFIEATAVHATGLLTPHTLGGYLPEIADGYRRLTAAVHPHGTKLFVQLFHGGREQIASPPRPAAVAPSAIPSARYKCEPRALTVREISEMVDGYRSAAQLALDGGLDGVELSFAHGYLAAQFFTRLTNRRSDGYNGDLNARLRFAREVLEAVHDVVGNKLALGVRLAANESGPGLLDRGECAEIAAALHATGRLDFVSMALGNSSQYIPSVGIAPPAPALKNAIARELSEVRAATAGLALIATTRVVDIEDAEQIVRTNRADLVGMTRALIADPELVAKARGAVSEPLIECVSCNQACIGHYHAGVPIGCAVNARTGHERSLQRAAAGSSAKRVLVIGGGPAGTACALEAARWGDAVELRERASALGGQLRLSGNAPAHQEMWTRWERMTAAQLERSAVTVRLDCEVTDSDDLSGWDQIVLATGAAPFHPAATTDLDGLRTVCAWEAIAEPHNVSGPVVVLDWGGDWAGLDAAEVLRAAGLEVTLVCAAIHPGESVHQYQRNLYLERIYSAGIKLVHHSELAVLDGATRIRNVFSGECSEFPACETLVSAQGRAPRDELWTVLEPRPEAVRVGDVLGPRGLEEATVEGSMAGYRGA